MSEKYTEVSTTYEVSYVCDKCDVGDMVCIDTRTDGVNPPMVLHACVVCNHRQYFPEKYPYLKSLSKLKKTIPIKVEDVSIPLVKKKTLTTTITNKLSKFFRNGGIAEDPVKICDTYIRFGCAHVDGPLCIPKTCSEFKRRTNQK